jgi:hypothetical protein
MDAERLKNRRAAEKSSRLASLVRLEAKQEADLSSNPKEQ